MCLILLYSKKFVDKTNTTYLLDFDLHTDLSKKQLAVAGILVGCCH